MVAACDVRVTRDENVARRNVTEGPQDGLHDQSAATGVDRDAVRLTDQAPAPVGQEAGEVMALIEDRAASGLQHDLAHALGNVVDPLLHKRQRYRIETARDRCGLVHRGSTLGPGRMTKLPKASTLQRSPGATTTLVVLSSMMAGPRNSAPGETSMPR